LRQNDKVLKQEDKVFGDFASHERQEKKITVRGDESWLKGHSPGDIIELFYIIGDGGGHELHIHSLKYEINYGDFDPIEKNKASNL
jgi:hypothetical protein